MIPPERIAEWKALAVKATRGDWFHGPAEDTRVMIRGGDRCVTVCRHTAVSEQAINDAAFIAAARQAVPELIGEVERLRDELERINGILGPMIDI
jgi:hypothetical protein